ncbi:MAG: molybdopterin-binding protein [Polyangiaceae bacterium]|jgi:molybdenum cofactor synthesis domain-containing protein|nr:molybdopterin-binding protein [Polyangiaceae bacterium]
MGTVVAVCRSERKGQQKSPIDEGRLLRGLGLDGDAHAGNWHRQVSLLADEDIAQMRAKGLALAPGAFGENLVTRDMDLEALAVGRRFRVGEHAVLQVTQHGKACHTRCAIYYKAGDCIMPRRGIFARVLRDGDVRPGDAVDTDAALDRFRFAVVTLSDRASQGEYEDTAGPRAIELVRQVVDGDLVEHRVLPDEPAQLKRELIRLADDELVDLVLTCGGTGLSPRDTTPETTREVIEREVPGIAEAIRAGGMKHTPRAMLSRGLAGQRGHTLVVNLSGSPRAVAEQLEVLLPVLPHALQMATGIPTQCARVPEG